MDSGSLFLSHMICLLHSREGARVLAQTQQKPNIVYILTDDLDTYTLNRMETTRSLLADQGNGVHRESR